MSDDANAPHPDTRFALIEHRVGFLENALDEIRENTGKTTEYMGQLTADVSRYGEMKDTMDRAFGAIKENAAKIAVLEKNQLVLQTQLAIVKWVSSGVGLLAIAQLWNSVFGAGTGVSP